ncbi:MAG: hypothetical protein AB9888_12940 [Bacteroidales bacterium]
MKTSSLIKWGDRLSWAVLMANLLLILAIPTESSESDLLFLLMILICFFGGAIGAITWLVIRHNFYFRTFKGLSSIFVCFLLSSLFTSSSILPPANERLSLLSNLSYILLGWGFGLSSAVFLIFHDIGIRIIAITTVVFVWGAFFAWKIQGNLIELLVNALTQTGQVTPLWWLSPSMCILGWLLPLSVISFFAHSVRIFAEK